MITNIDISVALNKLGVAGKQICVHSSFKSFSGEIQSPEFLIKTLMELCPTIIMPAFTWESNTAPPAYDRPENNGCDYRFYNDWNKPLKPFILERAGIEKSMGITAKKFLSFDGVLRSNHPWHSWAAWGQNKEQLVSNHPWNTTNLPLERLSLNGGYLLLIGVDLRSCTAVHVSEERAGRKPFIRWMADNLGVVRRVSASGCSKGFNTLEQHCDDLFTQVPVGQSIFKAARLDTFIKRCEEIIRRNPQLTVCSSDCIRCRDVSIR